MEMPNVWLTLRRQKLRNSETVRTRGLFTAAYFCKLHAELFFFLHPSELFRVRSITPGLKSRGRSTARPNVDHDFFFRLSFSLAFYEEPANAPFYTFNVFSYSLICTMICILYMGFR
uniref:Uncharacterized protein n=1 Tax=Glypta fumiferanae TaxID=389681 RepID=A0A0F6Q8W6_9HYME|nr:hypothetical protein [Glypta fumiferanae]